MSPAALIARALGLENKTKPYMAQDVLVWTYFALVGKTNHGSICVERFAFVSTRSYCFCVAYPYCNKNDLIKIPGYVSKSKAKLSAEFVRIMISACHPKCASHSFNLILLLGS